jgi:GNAT superfamily N-acetyltransferase
VSRDIRPLTAADIPALLPLVEQYWIYEDITHFDASQVARQLERLCDKPALGGGWLALSRGEIVGYLLAVYVFSLEHLGLTAEIDEFFVLPSARGKGLGALLLKAAEDEFARRGCTNVALQLGRGNHRARVFYRALGYRERSGYELLDKMLPDRRSG